MTVRIVYYTERRYDIEDCGTTLSAGMTLRIVVLH